MCVNANRVYSRPHVFPAPVSIASLLSTSPPSNRPAAWAKIILHAAFSRTGREGDQPETLCTLVYYKGASGPTNPQKYPGRSDQLRRGIRKMPAVQQ